MKEMIAGGNFELLAQCVVHCVVRPLRFCLGLHFLFCIFVSTVVHCFFEKSTCAFFSLVAAHASPVETRS